MDPPEALYTHAFETATPYLYPIDCSKINRILRPLRAKLAALHRDFQSAPATFASAALKNEGSTSEPDENQIDYHLSHRKRPKSASLKSTIPALVTSSPRHHSKLKYGSRQFRPAPQRLGLDSFYSSLPNNLVKSTTGISITSADFRSSKIAMPLRRHTNSLRDLVKDTVERLWWKPLCENSGLEETNGKNLMHPGAKRRVPSLVQLAAVVLGRQVEDVRRTKSEITQEGVDDIDNLYREVDTEHYVQLCIQQVPLVDMLDPIVEVCVNMRAEQQALTLLSHIIMNRLTTHHSIDLFWIYHAAQAISKTDEVVRTLCNYLTFDLAKRQSFSQFVIFVPFRHAVELIRKAAHEIASELIFRRDTTNTRPGHQSSQSQHGQNLMVQRSRLASWGKLLMTRSITTMYKMRPFIDANSCWKGHFDEPVFRACNDVLIAMAKDAAKAAMKMPELMNDIAISLCLHGLNLEVFYRKRQVDEADVLAGGETDMTTLNEWVSLIRSLNEAATGIASHRTPLQSLNGTSNTSHNHATSGKQYVFHGTIPLDLVFNSYRKLQHLLDLARMLDKLELYSVCVRVLTKIINEYGTLKRQQDVGEKNIGALAPGEEYDGNEIAENSDGGALMTLRELEEYMMEVERKVIMNEAGGCGEWEYEPVLDAWVLMSPCPVPNSLAASKTLSYQTNIGAITDGRANTPCGKNRQSSILSSPLAPRFANANSVHSTPNPSLSPFVIVQRRANGWLGRTWNNDEDDDENDGDYLPKSILKTQSFVDVREEKSYQSPFSAYRIYHDPGMYKEFSSPSSAEDDNVRRSPRHVNRDAFVKRNNLKSRANGDENTESIATSPCRKSFCKATDRQSEDNTNGHWNSNEDLGKTWNGGINTYGAESTIFTASPDSRPYESECDETVTLRIASKRLKTIVYGGEDNEIDGIDSTTCENGEKVDILELSLGEALPATNDIDDLANSMTDKDFENVGALKLMLGKTLPKTNDDDWRYENLLSKQRS
ncbi:hypothetical protein BC938DRAFT_483616 [Jimgerdemannia flammicorona]|uniref:Uncharacterized protein n=1 Tax=Jimgerdemannia flammicorona TaxID=994334 RepID=A0A433QBK1_9FUNG|nr:hypothetical protein BC938DRAFT_483616 [Jimgerdemannia flammicorona]